MTELFNNNVSTTLSAAINSTQTTITITSATGWPALATGNFYRAVLTSASVPGSTYEYLQVTGISGTTLTVSRGQENSTAQSWNSGDIIFMTATAASFTSFATASVAGVSSFNTRTGAVVPASGDYTVAQVTGAAPLASPALTGIPTAPTASTGTNTSQLATCAFVIANAGSGSSGVTSFNTRTGAVTLQGSDVTGALTYTPANINGTNATGTWAISISGNAATASSATTATSATTANSASTASVSTTTNGLSSTALNTANTWTSVQTISGNNAWVWTGSNGYTAIGPSNISLNSGGAAGIDYNSGAGGTVVTGNGGAFALVSDSSAGFSISASTAYKPGGGSWTASSDKRLKKDVANYTGGLDFINSLQPVTFSWVIPELENSEPTTGFIADSVMVVSPNSVTERELNTSINPVTEQPNSPTDVAIQQYLESIGDSNYEIKSIGFQNDIYAELVSAIQTLSAQVTELQTQVAALNK